MKLGKRSALMLLMILVLSLLMLAGCSSPQDQISKASDAAVPSATNAVAEEATATAVADPTTTPTEIPTVEQTQEPIETPRSTLTASTVGEPTTAPSQSDIPTPTEDVEPNQGMFDPWFEAYTSIAYSSGTDSEWAYGNQRKEFTLSKPCYVRVSNSVVAPWHWGYVYGLGSKITVTYRFTGAQNCTISVSDGFLTEVETNDPDTVVYTREIEAKSAREDNDIVVFQYTPNGVGSVTIEVVYDHQVKSKYDLRNSIYFVENEEW